MTRNEDVHGDIGTDSAPYTTDSLWEGDRDQRPSETVVTAVAEATGRDPEALRPLFEVIDPEALDKLFERNDSRSADAVNGLLAFDYEGCSVRVEAGGRTVVVPREDGEQ